MNNISYADKSVKPLLKIDNLIKTFVNNGSKTEVLKSISFNINKGDRYAITGPSGAGKSTLLNIIGTLDKPSSGMVLYRNTNLFSYSQKKLAEFRNNKLGFIFQFHHLLPEFNALENTIMPALIAGKNKSSMEEKGFQLLKKMGLQKRITHKPGEMSGGEQQRVAVARALIMEPEIVLADEPTGNLDMQTGREVFDLLLELNNELEITLIIVTHNKEFALKMSKRIVIEDGKTKI
jgi:lipoprotein-releasing system ATP-binding protein